MKKGIPSTRSAPRGFTLIETLFAILIFSAALISLLTISSKGISATDQVKNETVAYYLAQEGLEVVRNTRDTNFALSTGNQPVPWTNGFAGGSADCTATGGCYVVYNGQATPTLAQSSGLVDQEIMLTSSGQYGNAGTQTGFSRLITVAEQGTDGSEYTVTSVVTWDSKGINRSVKLVTFLKKWQ